MAAIFPNRIQQVRSLVDGPPVEVIHTHEATYAQDDRGQSWVRKRVSNTGWEELLSECLAWLLAAEIGAPVPVGAVYLGSNEESFLSTLVPEVVSHWRPGMMAEVKNLRDLGSIIALDVLLFNEDRHAGNFLLSSHAAGGVQAWGIDFGAAWVGWPEDFARRVDEIPRGNFLARGLPLDLLVEPALAATRTLQQTSTTLVSQFVREASDLAGSSQVEMLEKALSRRLETLPDLVTGFLRQNGA